MLHGKQGRGRSLGSLALSTVTSSRRHRAIRLGLLACVVLLLGPIGVGLLFGRSWIAHGIARAPNAGLTFRAEDDALSERDRGLGIDEQFRVNVASLGVASSMSVWIVEHRDCPRIGQVPYSTPYEPSASPTPDHRGGLRTMRRPSSWAAG